MRAIRARPKDYSDEDWHTALFAVLTSDLVLREQAIRDAADWATDHLGLQFKRLTVRGPIYQGLSAAIDHGILVGDIKVVAKEYIRRSL